MLKHLFSILLLLSLSGKAIGQNTLTYNDEKGSPKATLQDVITSYSIHYTKLYDLLKKPIRQLS